MREEVIFTSTNEIQRCVPDLEMRGFPGWKTTHVSRLGDITTIQGEMTLPYPITYVKLEI